MSETVNPTNPIPNSDTTNPNLNSASPNSPTANPNPNAANQNPSTTNPSPNPADPNSQISFLSTGIGTQTTRPKDYFAEQKAKDQTKKQAQSITRKRLIIIASSLGGVVLVAGLVWFIVAMVTAEPETPEIDFADAIAEQQAVFVAENGEYVFNSSSAFDIQSEYTEIISSNQDLPAEEVADKLATFFAKKIASVTQEDEKINLVLLEMQAYASLWLSDRVISAAQAVSIDDMTQYQASSYAGFLFNAYSTIGQNDLAEPYLNLLTNNE